MDMLAEVVGRIAELERRVAGIVRHGTVAQVDPAAARVRLRLGTADDGGDFLSPWVPYAQIAGALKAHVPPTPGQQFSLIAPAGDWRQAFAVPLTWTTNNPAPSGAGDENVITYGSVNLRLRADGLRIVVGGVTMEVTPSGVAITGGRVTHNGTNIGSDHHHGGVMPGGGVSGPPTT